MFFTCLYCLVFPLFLSFLPFSKVIIDNYRQKQERLLPADKRALLSLKKSCSTIMLQLVLLVSLRAINWRLLIMVNLLIIKIYATLASTWLVMLVKKEDNVQLTVFFLATSLSWLTKCLTCCLFIAHSVCS